MAALCVSLLLAALCIGTGRSDPPDLSLLASYTCYTCPVVISNANCLTPTNCSESDTYCMTSVGWIWGALRRFCCRGPVT
uniref:Snake toxin/toxin-like domain-containing protein n=1 Tax=Xenopus tropicalis TaxID=8364 RepID=A0A803JYD1_XENTR